MYSQINGISMSISLRPTFANICFYKQDLLARVKWLNHYTRYINDTLCVLDNDVEPVVIYEALTHCSWFEIYMWPELWWCAFFSEFICTQISFSHTVPKTNFHGLYTSWDYFCSANQRIIFVDRPMLRRIRKDSLLSHPRISSVIYKFTSKRDTDYVDRMEARINQHVPANIRKCNVENVHRGGNTICSAIAERFFKNAMCPFL